MTEETHRSWWQSRLDDLSERIEAGDYFVPAEEIAAAILFGRPKWGENPELIGDFPPRSSSRRRVSRGFISSDESRMTGVGFRAEKSGGSGKGG
jgi:hypothetical protein